MLGPNPGCNELLIKDHMLTILINSTLFEYLKKAILKLLSVFGMHSMIIALNTPRCNICNTCLSFTTTRTISASMGPLSISANLTSMVFISAKILLCITIRHSLIQKSAFFIITATEKGEIMIPADLISVNQLQFANLLSSYYGFQIMANDIRPMPDRDLAHNRRGQHG